MVIALIFRGVAFEFRFKAHRTKHLWDLAFIWGSVLTSFLQGIILGPIFKGLKLKTVFLPVALLTGLLHSPFSQVLV